MINIRSLTSFSPQEIRTLFKTARSIFATPFLDIRKASTQDPVGRMLLVIPRRVGNAVKRNKLRRRLKELFYGEQGYAKGSDFIFLAKSPEAASLSFEELQQIIKKVLHHD